MRPGRAVTAPWTSPPGATIEAQSIRRFCDVVFGYLDGVVLMPLPEGHTFHVRDSRLHRAVIGSGDIEGEELRGEVVVFNGSRLVHTSVDT